MESHNSWPFVSGFCFPGAQGNEEAKGSSGEGKAGSALRDWEGQNKHILPHPAAPGPTLTPGSRGSAMLLQVTGLAWASAPVICTMSLRPGALSDPRPAWAAGAWEAVLRADRVQLDAMRCLSLYGTTEACYRSSTWPNIHRKGKPDWPGRGLWKGRKATHVCSQRAAWAIKSLPRKILFEH